MTESEPLKTRLAEHFNKWEHFHGLNRKGFRMYNAIFQKGAEQCRTFLLEDPQGQELIRDLAARGIIIKIHQAKDSGQVEDGTAFQTLDLVICHPQRPLNDEERALIGKFIPPSSFSGRGNFHEIGNPFNDKWELLYATPKPDEEPPDEMRQGGFFTVIGCDTWDPGDPMLDGEFDTLEEALQRVREIVEENRELQMISLEGVMEHYPQDSSHYWSLKRKTGQIRDGEKAATSEVLYVYHPNGDFLNKFRV